MLIDSFAHQTEGMAMENQAQMRVLRALHWLLRRLLRCEVTGLENLPKNGPYVLAVNHRSLIDAFIMVTVIDRWMVFVAKHTLFKIPVLGRLMRWAGYIPAIPGGDSLQRTATIEHMGYLLDQGSVVCIFPEGYIVTAKKPFTRIRSGVQTVGQRHAVVPVVITGADSIAGGKAVSLLGALWRFRRPVTVTVHPVIPAGTNRTTVETTLKELFIDT